jgi:hypothetical protein
MADVIKVHTQAELDAALALTGEREIWICGAGRFVLRGTAQHYVRATESSHVEARGSSHVEARGSSHVEAWESSHVEAWESSHVEAWGSSHVEAWESSHVEARGSSHVVARGSSHVEAWESSHVEARGSSHVEAWGSSHVVARESSHVVARGAAFVRQRDRAAVKVAPNCSVVVMRHAAVQPVDGGTVIDVAPITTVEGWCDYHGIEVAAGVAVLYKAVDRDYRSGHGFLYAPGSIPVASDWDGGKRECGGGLHFSPRPVAAKAFHPSATKFLACPIRLTDIRPPRADDAHPEKVKARGCCGPVSEVTLWGEPVPAVAV